MHLFIKISIMIGSNALALWLADKYAPNFVLHTTWLQLLLIALVLALLNAILKPILMLILGPVIILTLGAGILMVNAIMIYLLPIIANHLDMLKGSITIETIPALIFGTIIVSVVNLIIHLII